MNTGISAGINTEKPLKIQVIVGSTRENRFAERPANWIYEVASQTEGIEVELVDLRDYPMPFYEGAIPPARLGGKYPLPEVQRWADKIAEADGYIIVSPEYNHGYSAVLKNAFDHTYPEWNNKPVGFFGYGNAGGARAVEQLRQVAIEMQMAPIKIALQVPLAAMMAYFRPQPDDPARPFDVLTDQANGFLAQLTWWAKALKTAREADRQPQPA